jgi:hypothetical protein
MVVSPELTMPLEKELAFFESKKDELFKVHPGKFALIHGEEFLGAFDTPENAYGAGVEKFGNGPFLVKRISPEPEVYRNQALMLGLMNARI